MSKSVSLLNLGIEPYQRAWDLQHRLVALRREGKVGDVFILLEHTPVLTIGRQGNESNILVSPAFLAEQGVEVYRVERGGDVTYHGPGQLVGYPILDLGGHHKDVRWYVRSLEEVLIRSLAEFGIEASRVEGSVGVWAGDKKIAAIGARIEHWITYHGFALNVAPNMKHWQLIVPCGIEGKDVVSMEQILGHAPDMQAVRQAVANHFGEVFGVELQEISLDDLGLAQFSPEQVTLVSQ
ncbi:MAG: lipoyl(octanoyl) transferase LipB [Chloroflexi bacterium]|nr:lipoyl(octanoyl) transferase LipB [Chloroflexota bacterium]